MSDGTCVRIPSYVADFPAFQRTISKSQLATLSLLAHVLGPIEPSADLLCFQQLVTFQVFELGMYPPLSAGI